MTVPASEALSAIGRGPQRVKSGGKARQSCSRIQNKVAQKARLQACGPTLRKIAQAKHVGTTQIHAPEQRHQNDAHSDITAELSSRLRGNSEPAVLRATPQDGSRVECTLDVRETVDVADFREIGWMRAQAYYQANPAGRLQESLVRQFAQQEACSLQNRTKPRHGIEHPETICYVIKAFQEGSSKESVVGSLDINLPACATGCHPKEVPSGDEEDKYGAYLLNVVVHDKWQRQGCGRAMIVKAEEDAAEHWSAARIYTKVDANNEAASNLYKQMGYEPHAEQPAGRDILLCKQLSVG